MISLKSKFKANSKKFIKNLNSNSNSNDLSRLFDILIVGGGPVGLSLASSLSSNELFRSLRIGLIESNDLSSIKNGVNSQEFSNRCSSISYQNFHYLKNNGSLNNLNRSRISSINNIQVLDGVTNSRLSFGNASDDDFHLSLDKPNQTLSYMIENVNLQHSFIKNIEQSPNVNIFDSSSIINIENVNEFPTLTLSDGQSLSTRLLIGADGFNSPVRKFAKIDSFGWPYNAAGLVSTLKIQNSINDNHSSKTAFQRFLPTGPIAYLPLPNSTASMVWSTSPELAKKLKEIDSRILVMLVNAAFRFNSDLLEILYKNLDLSYDQFVYIVKQLEINQGIDMTTSKLVSESDSLNEGIPPSDYLAYPPFITSVVEGSQASFPLKLNHTDGYNRLRVALVGDAAHSCHPLAGQGLNLGIGDIKSLIQALSYARQHGSDIGSNTILEMYTRDRYLQNMKMLSITDKLNTLFKAKGQNPLVQLRSIGLESINEIESVKKVLMDEAGGNVENDNVNKGVEIIADGIQGIGNVINMISKGSENLIKLTQNQINQRMK